MNGCPGHNLAAEAALHFVNYWLPVVIPVFSPAARALSLLKQRAYEIFSLQSVGSLFIIQRLWPGFGPIRYGEGRYDEAACRHYPG